MSDEGPTSYLAERIRSGLAQDPRVATLGLVVRAVAGRIFIAGTVSSDACRDAVGVVAAELAGAIVIINETVVTASLPPEARPEMIT